MQHVIVNGDDAVPTYYYATFSNPTDGIIVVGFSKVVSLSNRVRYPDDIPHLALIDDYVYRLYVDGRRRPSRR